MDSEDKPGDGQLGAGSTAEQAGVHGVRENDAGRSLEYRGWAV